MVLRPNMTRAEIESATVKFWSPDPKTIYARCLDTFTIALDARDASLTGAIKDHGYWESWITAWHTKHVKPGMLYLDGGANCGYYSLLAAHLGAQVWAFEPNPRYVDLIREARYENGLSDLSIFVEAVALSNASGSVQLNFFDNFDGSASIVAKTSKSIDVRATTLDTYPWADEDVILKLDVEGAEELALMGGTNFISKNNVTILLEYTPGAYSDDFWHLLESFGQVFLVDYEGNETTITHHQAEAHTDWITLVVHPFAS